MYPGGLKHSGIAHQFFFLFCTATDQVWWCLYCTFSFSIHIHCVLIGYSRLTSALDARNSTPECEMNDYDGFNSIK